MSTTSFSIITRSRASWSLQYTTFAPTAFPRTHSPVQARTYSTSAGSGKTPTTSKTDRRHGSGFWTNHVHYTQLRSEAVAAAERMAEALRESQRAYWRGDGARAKALSHEGQRWRTELERLNKEASEWVFARNNQHTFSNEVDLHDLTVKEMVDFATRAVENARSRGLIELHLVVGKGLHSPDGVAKLKPTIEKLMHDYQFTVRINPRNAGVLTVHLGAEGGNGLNLDRD